MHNDTFRSKTYAFHGNSDEELRTRNTCVNFSPKGVKRGKNPNGALTCKINKLYDCDENEISYCNQFGALSDELNQQTTRSINTI